MVCRSADYTENGGGGIAGCNQVLLCVPAGFGVRFVSLAFSVPDFRLPEMEKWE